MDVPKPVLVAIGGVAGAATRWAVTEWIDSALWSLVGVNSFGAFLLGFLVRSRIGGHGLRLFFGIGFCGALTTFSPLALDVAARLDDGHLNEAAEFTFITVTIGLAAAVAGTLLGARSTSRETR